MALCWAMAIVSQHLSDINCTPHHLSIVRNLRPVFAGLSVLGVAVWWYAWLLAAAMAVDALVVQGRRRLCCHDEHATKMHASLALCVVSALVSGVAWACMLASTVQAWSHAPMTVYAVAAPLVYAVWVPHFFLTLSNLSSMITWMSDALALEEKGRH